MSNDTTRTHVTQVGRIILPVSDQDRALDFYVNTLGFEKRVDAPSPTGRWLEVAPTGAATSIALVAPQADDARISLTTEDADAFHADLVGRGLDASQEVMRVGGSVPPMFAFRDPDGNSIRVSQQA